MAPPKQYGSLVHAEHNETLKREPHDSHYSHYVERLIMVRTCPACMELSKRLPARGR